MVVELDRTLGSLHDPGQVKTALMDPAMGFSTF